MKDLVQIGFTGKVHGLKGELKLIINDPFQDEIDEQMVFFIKIGSQFLPFFPENIRFGSGIIAKFDEINSREDAMQIASKELYTRKTYFDLEKMEDPRTGNLEFGHLIRFHIVDLHYGPVGKILDILEYPQQEMALVQFGEKEILIPMLAEFISSINNKDKLVNMDLPDGMLEL